MMRAVWFRGGRRREVLLITAHHLAVDVVSWHIMLGDIAEAWRSVQAGAVPKTLPELTSYRRWSQLMWERTAEHRRCKTSANTGSPRSGAKPILRWARGIRTRPRYLVNAASEPGHHPGSDTSACSSKL